MINHKIQIALLVAKIEDAISVLNQLAPSEEMRALVLRIHQLALSLRDAIEEKHNTAINQDSQGPKNFKHTTIGDLIDEEIHPTLVHEHAMTLLLDLRAPIEALRKLLAAEVGPEGDP